MGLVIPLLAVAVVMGLSALAVRFSRQLIHRHVAEGGMRWLLEHPHE